jgi:hypothetical protein
MPDVFTTSIPDLDGRALPRAQEMLQAAQRRVGTVYQQESSRPRGTVMWQEPVAGQEVTARSEVRVWVSEGFIPDPGVFEAPQTHLVWTRSDNGEDVDWDGANAYCQALMIGTSADWRLPTETELEALYDGKFYDQPRNTLWKIKLRSD